MKLTFDNDDQNVEGVGLAQATWSSNEEKLANVSKAQKSSKTAAMLNAFSKIILVLVKSENSLKVTVRIDAGQVEPFHYKSLWDHDALLEPELEK